MKAQDEKSREIKMWKFIPILKQTIWGGHKIAHLKEIEAVEMPIGESWEISSLPGSVSVVEDGADKGKSIYELVAREKDKLLGKENYQRFGDEFPLLIKFIDAEKDLSIQVHPDDEMASKFQQKGKTEMWYVVDATEDTKICNGFIDRLNPSECSAMIKSGTIENHLNYLNISEGDAYYIPAGRIHAIGAGALLVEVQQSSDVTYRVYDYNRRDKDGCLRELHVDLAQEALDFSEVGEYRVSYERVDNAPMLLKQTEFFTTRLYHLTQTFVRDYSEIDSFMVLVVTNGECEITVGDSKRKVKAGETILIEASAKSYRVDPYDDVTIVESYIENHKIL